MTKLNRKCRVPRGYPLSVLVGFEEKGAVIWRVFSKVVKLYMRVESSGRKEKQVYSFHESVVDALRPLLKEGMRSIVLSAAMNTKFSREFLDHVQRHHRWLISNTESMVTFGELTGSACNVHEVSLLVKTQEFRKLLSEVIAKDADHLIDTLENYLNESDRSAGILYSLEEVEYFIERREKQAQYNSCILLMTDRYLSDTRQGQRAHRLLQMATNRNVKTTVVSVNTKAGSRLSQLGGIVCITLTH